MNPTPISILLVDDDPKNLLALEAILESPDHRLVKAQTADEALLALMRDDYAAIVLDVQMPDLSGIELAKLIKQRKRTQHIPILFLTAHYRENEHAMLAYDAGAVDYLTKPVHPSVLRSKVSVFVDLFRKTRALAAMNSSLEAEVIERKTAEERFRIVVEAAPSAMLVFTHDGSIVLVNSQAELLFGRPRATLLTSKIQDLLSSEDIPNFEDAIVSRGFGAEIPCPREITVNHPDGIQVPAEISYTPIQSTEGIRLLASVLDVTERKHAEAALRSANAELEAKNTALQRQARERLRRIRAEAAQAEAEAANAAKDRFLAMLSHELRTPLSAVLHGVTLLDEPEDCPTELRETLQLIRRNVQLEARLIDDLLDLARIRNGKLQLQLQAVDAHELLRLALDICRRDIAARGLRVDTHLDATQTHLDADPARLQQIFWNLISNAVKFTPAGGLISIATRDDDGRLAVEVSDSGVGIDSEKLARIFDAFEQGSKKDQAGLGLGLAICKALTEFHGGEISAKSGGNGSGATFTVRLPVGALDAVIEQPAEPQQQPPTSVPLRLLLVEDHQDTAATLLRLLVRRGYEVQSASSVSSALDVAQTYPFDVLVSDIGLPDGTGVELLKKLRDTPHGSHIHGIALSGFGMDEDIARSKDAGFSEHLTKPVDFAHLQESLIRLAQQLTVGRTDETPSAAA